MTVKLLTEHHLEVLSLKRGCVYTCQNATLLEITCHGSYVFGIHFFRDIDIENTCFKTGNKDSMCYSPIHTIVDNLGNHPKVSCFHFVIVPVV